ncbi:AcrR family transcriptional regulator [Amycolatopsis lexingtonensis]|uniref:AcrR family transcriptional regulator n=1 Tax=Amycolatopsis lexingtonensis TaxID=218822 RepID=A0ABR9IDR9_9PSEU|nr:TetR/AcrR family transcriptional regulator [Amycolatopsis lexingtonensis]MBE1501330.1 AcrR family transcriptional regulator [Amycolatopsis lexingtonensis]
MARTPTGAAVLQPEVTRAISEAVMWELAEQGFGRLSMEAVAKRAGVGKSALYRRWTSKEHMIASVVTEFSVTRAAETDTGTLRGDLRETMQALIDWLTHPLFSRILPDLVAEDARAPEYGRGLREAIGGPRREVGEKMLRRAITRGELPADLDMEMALDVLAAPIYWRLVVRQAEAEPDYVDRLVAYALRALGARDT